MKHIFVFLSGLLFGLGLIISGMANPAKVLNFLDLFGSWDPSLLFVMSGAILLTAPAYTLLNRYRETPFFSNVFYIPKRSDIDLKLLSGAAIFGIGWGLGGFCPGPALTSLLLIKAGTFAFIPAMLIGIYLGHWIYRT